MVSVDTKKQELVGADPGYRNNSRDYQPKGRPVRVGVHDFPDPAVPKAVPYGIYDLAANTGWVSVGERRAQGSSGVVMGPASSRGRSMVPTGRATLHASVVTLPAATVGRRSSGSWSTIRTRF